MNTILPDVKIADRDIEFLFYEFKARINRNKIIKYLSLSHDAEVKEILAYLNNNNT